MATVGLQNRNVYESCDNCTEPVSTVKAGVMLEGSIMNHTVVFSICNMVHSEALTETVHALRYVFVLLNEGILDLCD